VIGKACFHWGKQRAMKLHDRFFLIASKKTPLKKGRETYLWEGLGWSDPDRTRVIEGKRTLCMKGYVGESSAAEL